MARDSTTRLINLWPLVRTCYPSSSVNAPFHGYSKLQLHGTFDDRMTGIELATLQLRRPRTNRLSYVFFLKSSKGKTAMSLCSNDDRPKVKSRGEGVGKFWRNAKSRRSPPLSPKLASVTNVLQVIVQLRPVLLFSEEVKCRREVRRSRWFVPGLIHGHMWVDFSCSLLCSVSCFCYAFFSYCYSYFSQHLKSLFNRPNRLARCCTQFKSRGVKIFCVAFALERGIHI